MLDVYRLKHNFGYWLLSYHKMEFDIFSEKLKAVVEHHFNNHVHCDDWCSMKKKDVTMTATGNLKYHCKKENANLYKQIVEVMICGNRKITRKPSWVQISEEQEYEQSGIQIHSQRQEILSNYVTDVKSMYSCWCGQCGSQ
jgi:hypothetical protein